MDLWDKGPRGFDMSLVRRVGFLKRLVQQGHLGNARQQGARAHDEAELELILVK